MSHRYQKYILTPWHIHSPEVKFLRGQLYLMQDTCWMLLHLQVGCVPWAIIVRSCHCLTLTFEHRNCSTDVQNTRFRNAYSFVCYMPLNCNWTTKMIPITTGFLVQLYVYIYCFQAFPSFCQRRAHFWIGIVEKIRFFVSFVPTEWTFNRHLSLFDLVILVFLFIVTTMELVIGLTCVVVRATIAFAIACL